MVFNFLYLFLQGCTSRLGEATREGKFGPAGVLVENPHCRYHFRHPVTFRSDIGQGLNKASSGLIENQNHFPCVCRIVCAPGSHQEVTIRRSAGIDIPILVNLPGSENTQALAVFTAYKDAMRRYGIREHVSAVNP